MHGNFNKPSSIDVPADTEPWMFQLLHCVFSKSWIRTPSRHAIQQVRNLQLSQHDCELIGQPLTFFTNPLPSSPAVPARAQGPQHAITIIVTHSLTPPTLTAHAQEPQDRRAQPCVRQHKPNIHKHQCRSACSTRGLSCAELRNHQSLALASIALISSRTWYQ